MRRHLVRSRTAVQDSCRWGACCVSKRSQYFVGEQRTTAHRSKTAFSHPLAPKDPATRNIAIPDSLLRGKGVMKREDKLPAEFAKKRAQMALLQQMQQEVLWDGTVLDEPNHKLVQHFLKLSSNPKYRDARRMMMVGGREMIRELCEGGHVPKHLMVTEGKAIPEWARREQARQRMDIVLVNRTLADEFAPGNDGYIGDFDIPAPPMKEELIANKLRMNRVLVLDNVDDAGVLGTVLRTAAGFQYDAIIATNHCADLYDHRVIRAARGAHFQSGVPIYSLKEEDGDDVYGMINHIIRRNNLLPVCFTPVNDEEVPSNGGSDGAQRMFHSSVVGADPIPIPDQLINQGFAKPQQQSLSEFCLRQFTLHEGRGAVPKGDDAKEQGHRQGDMSVRKRQQESLASPGYVLFTGPNHKRNMVRRLTQRVIRKPTSLLLDSMPSEPDYLLSLSVVLHALRPTGDWDYLPVNERSEPSSPALQTRTASVDIGANRLIVSEKSLNLDEDEQREAAHLSNEFKKWRRLRRKQKTDYEFWMEAEEARVRAMQHNEAVQRLTPWDTRKLKKKGLARAENGGMPDWVPNIIDEYRQPLDRDRLRDERDTAENYVRPSNYSRYEK